jgi:hypothetical protein
MLFVGGVGLTLAGFAGKGLPGWLFGPGIAAIILSPLAGWAWWSFSVPRWRRWALIRGAADKELYKWGVMTGLMWPRGSIFEKKELQPKD